MNSIELNDLERRYVAITGQPPEMVAGVSDEALWLAIGLGDTGMDGSGMDDEFNPYSTTYYEREAI